jgi:tetratricopeptide (TPR) repeat protein
LIKKILGILKYDQGVVIQSPSGTGKSRLANQIGNIFIESNEFIVRFLKSDTIDKLELDFGEFAQLLLKIDQRSKSIEMLLKMMDAKIKKYPYKFLIVFDNLANYELIQDYVRYLPSDKVKFIITARQDCLNLNNHYDIINITPFANPETNNYLASNLKQSLSEKQTDKLIKLLEMDDGVILPLELYISAKYINESLSDIETFYRDFDQANSIYKLLFLKLSYESIDSFELFKYCAHLDADIISFNVLKAILNTQVIAPYLIQLKKFGFIQIDYCSMMIETHRLIQKEFINFLKEYTDYNETECMKVIIGCMFNLCKSDVIIEYDYMQIDRIIKKLNLDQENLTQTFRYEHVFQLKNKLAYFNLTYKKDYKDSLTNYMDLFEFLRLSNEPDKESEITDSVYGIACSYFGLGDYQKSLEYHQHTFLMREKIIEDDPIQLFALADSNHELGNCYLKLNKYEKSQEAYQKALNIRKRPNLNRASTLHCLAECLVKMKDYENAYQTYVAAYEIRQKHQNNSNNKVDLAKTLFELGNLGNKLGYYEKSFNFHVEGYKIRQDLYEIDHPELADSLYAIGDGLDKKGDFKKSLDFHLKAYEMRKHIYKANKYEVLFYLMAALMSFKQMGSLTDLTTKKTTTTGAEKKKTGEETDRILKRFNQNLNPYLAQSLHAIGFAHLRLGQDAYAFENINLAMKLRESLYLNGAIEANEMIESFDLMAKYYAKIGDDKKFYEYYLKRDELEKKETSWSLFDFNQFE